MEGRGVENMTKITLALFQCLSSHPRPISPTPPHFPCILSTLSIFLFFMPFCVSIKCSLLLSHPLFLVPSHSIFLRDTLCPRPVLCGGHYLYHPSPHLSLNSTRSRSGGKFHNLDADKRTLQHIHSCMVRADALTHHRTILLLLLLISHHHYHLHHNLLLFSNPYPPP